MEVINANNGKYNETSRVYRQIVLHLDQKIPQQNIYQLIEKVGRNADLEERNIRMALQLMKRLEITGFSAGRDPMGIAGAIIYISLPYSNKKSMKKGITQKQISDAAGVSEVTIRAVAKEISKKLRLE
jgi:transcription initiation factor TFIIB